MKNKMRLLKILILFFMIPLSVSASTPLKDEVLDTFIAETIPAQAQQVQNKVLLNTNDENGEKITSLQVNAYTYRLNRQVYTILDIYTTEKLTTTKEDIWKVVMNDDLWPLEMVDGQLFVKKRTSDSWEFSKKLDTLSNLYGFDFYGSQIFTHKPFIRILSCFLSDQNLDKAGDISPEYTITYHSSKEFYIPIPVILIGFACLVSVLFLMLKHRNNSTRKE